MNSIVVFAKDRFKIDIKLESWIAGKMKTTIDLPEELVRQMKLRAVNEGRKLKEVAAEVFRQGLMQTGGKSLAKDPRQKIELPLFKCSKKAPARRMKFKDLQDFEIQVQTKEDWKHVGGTF